MAEMLVNNKKATFNFAIEEKMVAGISLLGHEVKSIRGKQGSFEGAYIILRGGEAFLTGAYIPPYQMNNTPQSYDPYRNRKLLLEKKEIEQLVRAEKESGLTIIPLSFTANGPNIKLNIAIAKGKKKHDKRETIKKRDVERDLGRKLKG